MEKLLYVCVLSTCLSLKAQTPRNFNANINGDISGDIRVRGLQGPANTVAGAANNLGGDISGGANTISVALDSLGTDITSAGGAVGGDILSAGNVVAGELNATNSTLKDLDKTLDSINANAEKALDPTQVFLLSATAAGGAMALQAGVDVVVKSLSSIVRLVDGSMGEDRFAEMKTAARNYVDMTKGAQSKEAEAQLFEQVREKAAKSGKTVRQTIYEEMLEFDGKKNILLGQMYVDGYPVNQDRLNRLTAIMNMNDTEFNQSMVLARGDANLMKESAARSLSQLMNKVNQASWFVKQYATNNGKDMTKFGAEVLENMRDRKAQLEREMTTLEGKGSLTALEQQKLDELRFSWKEISRILSTVDYSFPGQDSTDTRKQFTAFLGQQIQSRSKNLYDRMMILSGDGMIDQASETYVMEQVRVAEPVTPMAPRAEVVSTGTLPHGGSSSNSSNSRTRRSGGRMRGK